MDFASVLEAGGSLALSIGVFAFAVWLNRKTNSPLLNPLLVTVAIIMIGLTVFNIPLDSKREQRSFRPCSAPPLLCWRSPFTSNAKSCRAISCRFS